MAKIMIIGHKMTKEIELSYYFEGMAIGSHPSCVLLFPWTSQTRPNV